MVINAAAVVHTDDLDDLINRYHQAIWHELPNVMAIYEEELSEYAADKRYADRVEAAFAYPFDRGIPKYRSARWLAIRFGQYPLGDWVEAVRKKLLPISKLNSAQRRSLGFRMPKSALEYYGL